MKTCGRCGHDFGTLHKCVVCERKVCGGCSMKSTLNDKRICTRGRCCKTNKRNFQMSPSTVDVSTITEYGLTQKLSNSVRVF